MTVTRRNRLAAAVLGVISLYATAAAAQQPFTNTVCRAGTISVLAKAENLMIYSLDHQGVSRDENDRKHFDNWTQRCVGTVGVFAGKPTGGGYCKSVDPASGDMTMIDWASGDKPGTGTWRFVAGTGKWKGVSGGGTYTNFAPNRPTQEGTYQNCITAKGTYLLP